MNTEDYELYVDGIMRGVQILEDNFLHKAITPIMVEDFKHELMNMCLRESERRGFYRDAAYMTNAILTRIITLNGKPLADYK